MIEAEVMQQVKDGFSFSFGHDFVRLRLPAICFANRRKSHFWIMGIDMS